LEKCGTTGQATDDSVAHGHLRAGYLGLQTLTVNSAVQRLRAVRCPAPRSTTFQQGMVVLAGRDVGGYPLTHLVYEIRAWRRNLDGNELFTLTHVTSTVQLRWSNVTCGVLLTKEKRNALRRISVSVCVSVNMWGRQ
jgi:hypothetical protein